MLKEQSQMVLNAKGHVKLELYDENDNVFYTKQKKNIVVQSATKIVAQMMADPSKVLRISQVDKGDSSLSANADVLYPFGLSVKGESKMKFENNWGLTNTQVTFELAELKGLTSIDKITVGAATLVANVDYFLLDSEKGKIKFAVAPTENVAIFYHKVTNPFMKMIPGTEVVKVNGVTWNRGAVAKNSTTTYQVSARTGEVFFETAQTKVEVAYDYNMNYSLGFMSLGGKPNALHPNYQPVEFGKSNLLDTLMANEYAGARMPIQYPSSISTGATELEPAIPTQPIATVAKTKDLAITHNGDGVTKLLKYELPNLHDTGSGNVGRTLHEFITIRNVTKSADIQKANVTITTNTMNKIEITFLTADVAMNDTVRVDYRLKLDDRHLIYQLGQAPVVELVSVKHMDAATGTAKAYTIVEGGLRVNQGEVWISNPNTGHITFSSAPTSGAPKVETPGQLTIEYKVNSGTVVKFVADFPKGVPAPVLEDTVKNTSVTSGQTSVVLDYAIAKDSTGAFIAPVVKVTANGVPTTLSSGQYTISLDGKTITINSLAAGNVVNVTSKYEKSTHDIYQVAMFDDKVDGKMFNISGIGPVTKDKNTGMRVTWSVTF